MTMMKVVLLLLTATLTVMIRCSAAEGETTTVSVGKLSSAFAWFGKATTGNRHEIRFLSCRSKVNHYQLLNNNPNLHSLEKH